MGCSGPPSNSYGMGMAAMGTLWSWSRRAVGGAGGGGGGAKGGGEGGGQGGRGAIVCPGGAASMGHNGALMKRFVKIQSHVPTVRPPPPMPPSPLPPPPPFPLPPGPLPLSWDPHVAPRFWDRCRVPGVGGSMGLGAPWGWGLHGGCGGSMELRRGPWCWRCP